MDFSEWIAGAAAKAAGFERMIDVGAAELAEAIKDAPMPEGLRSAVLGRLAAGTWPFGASALEAVASHLPLDGTKPEGRSFFRLAEMARGAAGSIRGSQMWLRGAEAADASSAAARSAASLVEEVARFEARPSPMLAKSLAKLASISSKAALERLEAAGHHGTKVHEDLAGLESEFEEISEAIEVPAPPQRILAAIAKATKDLELVAEVWMAEMPAFAFDAFAAAAFAGSVRSGSIDQSRANLALAATLLSAAAIGAADALSPHAPEEGARLASIADLLSPFAVQVPPRAYKVDLAPDRSMAVEEADDATPEPVVATQEQEDEDSDAAPMHPKSSLEPPVPEGVELTADADDEAVPAGPRASEIPVPWRNLIDAILRKHGAEQSAGIVELKRIASFGRWDGWRSIEAISMHAAEVDAGFGAVAQALRRMGDSDA